MTCLHFDYETRSPVNLKTHGSYVYACDPRTEILICSYAIDDEKPETWFVVQGELIPKKLKEAFLDPSVTLCAHNVGFERGMTLCSSLRNQKPFSSEILQAMKPIERWQCSAARAAYMGLPRSLEGAGAALGLSVRKDVAGSKIMLKLCKPRAFAENGDIIWWDYDDSIQRLAEYCECDVRAEHALGEALPILSPFEKDMWMVTEKMNNRGVMVDSKLLQKMIPFVQAAEEDINDNLFVKTGRFVPSAKNHIKLRRWLTLEGYPDIDGDGNKIGVGKAVVNAILENPDLPDHVREVLLLRQDGGKSSNAKYKSLQRRLSVDSRIRGSFLYCGATSTHRFSSVGLQLQNLPSGGKIKTINTALEDVLKDATISDIQRNHGSPMIVASELIRPMFTAAPGYWFVRGDYAQIELRVNAWLSKEEHVLEAFRKYDTLIGGLDEKGKPLRAGPDIYIVSAAAMMGLTVEEIDYALRQIGKVCNLSLGFGGGVGALRKMAKIYNVKIEEEKAEEVVNAFRNAHPNIRHFGKSLLEAMFSCMKSPPGNKHFPLSAVVNNYNGKTFYNYTGEPIRSDVWFMRNSKTIALRMPSGNHLFYWYPRIERKETPWGERDILTFMAVGEKSKFTRFDMWHGLILENIVQGIARDGIAYALILLNKEPGVYPVMTVHDEADCEVCKKLYANPVEAAMVVDQTMRQAPDWARGLPLAVDSSAGDRYVKS